MQMQDMLKEMVARKVADVFIIAGRPVCYRQGYEILPLDGGVLMPRDTQALIQDAYRLAQRDEGRLTGHGDDDFSFSLPGVARFRVNAYKQRGSLAAVIRVVPFVLPRPEALGIPEAVMALAARPRGLMLVTGPSGSGKTTTLACLIDRINQTRAGHIITLENPIEYLHSHKKCILSQREIDIDTDGYAVALRAALRQSPDVILIGELRDPETISIALTAAETGHFVISTLHTLGAANTIDRLVDAFPASQQEQARMQLSMVLQCVVSQQLLNTPAGGLVPAFEILHATTAIRNMIREGRTHQISAALQSSAGDNMVSMDMSIAALYRAGSIDAAEALKHAMNPETLEKQLRLQV